MIREILRRLQSGDRARRIARDLGISRHSVAHYRRWATTRGLLLPRPLPELVLARDAKGVEGPSDLAAAR